MKTPGYMPQRVLEGGTWERGSECAGCCSTDLPQEGISSIVRQVSYAIDTQYRMKSRGILRQWRPGF